MLGEAESASLAILVDLDFLAGALTSVHLVVHPRGRVDSAARAINRLDESSSSFKAVENVDFSQGSEDSC